ncbi:MAG: DNA-processing protein DprA [Marinifilaceae bacterium]
MSHIDTNIAHIALAFLPKWNRINMLPVLEKLGSFSNLLTMGQKRFDEWCQTNLTASYHFNIATVIASAQREFETMRRLNIEYTYYEDVQYPAQLKECSDAPLVLFYKGSIAALTSPSLAIVGTRKASKRCCTYIEQIIEQLAFMTPSLPIVSGLAYGIDITAHRSALNHNLPTFAVLAHGLHTVYPAAHNGTARDIILHGGALISEYPTATTTHIGNFLQRNRIVAGLSTATLIAESGVKGGAMTTAQVAFSYSRDVLAIPGRPDDALAAGCNQLIRRQVAQLVTNAEEIAQILGITGEIKTGEQLKFDFFNATTEEELILQTLRKGVTSLRDLMLETQIPLSMLQSTLLQMELQQKVRALPGDIYEGIY